MGGRVKDRRSRSRSDAGGVLDAGTQARMMWRRGWECSLAPGGVVVGGAGGHDASRRCGSVRRDHLRSPCPGCGHHPDTADLTAAITKAPRNRTGRTRTAPRTTRERQTQHGRNVIYTIKITESNLPRTT